VTSNGKRRRPIWKWARWLTVAISLAGIIYLLVWYVPDAIARRNANPSVESAYICAVAGLLGVAATAAVAIFAFWYSRLANNATIEAAKDTTDKTVQTALDTNKANIDAAREAQFPDRYGKTIELVGSDNLDVRIGGIYALGGIAADYARHQPTVMELLAAFIREHSGEPWPVPESDGAPVPERTTRPDVQAALTVIGHRDTAHYQGAINLSHAALYQANLYGAKLAYANLRGGYLALADLTRANLTGAKLAYAELTELDLAKFFTGAKLTGPRTGAELGSPLRSANLTGASLVGADLTGARLMGVDLTGADLTHALLPPPMVVPEGWQRDADTGRLERGGTKSAGPKTK
jgi:Pentapeptide repeats (8 copies)